MPGCMTKDVINFAFMCDSSFCIGILDKCALSSANTSSHTYTTSQLLQMNTIIPLKFRKNLNVYLPVQRVFFLPGKRSHCVYVYSQNQPRNRYLIPQEAL